MIEKIQLTSLSTYVYRYQCKSSKQSQWKHEGVS